MDLHDLWQQHKRWILGVLAGVILFWIGWLVIDSVWSPVAAVRSAKADANAVSGSGELFTEAALAALREENEKLMAAERELHEALAWQTRPQYQLEGKGAADLVFDKINRDIRKSLRIACEERNVELPEKIFTEWSQPSERDEIQATLIAFDLMDHAVQRLLAAHDLVRKSDPEALGVVAIEKLKVDRQRAGAGPRNVRGARETRVRAEELFQEERVEFELKADPKVVSLFLEACHGQKPPIALSDLKISLTKQPGEALAVKGKLVAILFKPEPAPQ